MSEVVWYPEDVVVWPITSMSYSTPKLIILTISCNTMNVTKEEKETLKQYKITSTMWKWAEVCGVYEPQ